MCTELYTIGYWTCVFSCVEFRICRHWRRINESMRMPKNAFIEGNIPLQSSRNRKTVKKASSSRTSTILLLRFSTLCRQWPLTSNTCGLICPGNPVNIRLEIFFFSWYDTHVLCTPYRAVTNLQMPVYRLVYRQSYRTFVAGSETARAKTTGPVEILARFYGRAYRLELREFSRYDNNNFIRSFRELAFRYPFPRLPETLREFIVSCSGF